MSIIQPWKNLQTLADLGYGWDFCHNFNSQPRIQRLKIGLRL